MAFLKKAKTEAAETEAPEAEEAEAAPAAEEAPAEATPPEAPGAEEGDEDDGSGGWPEQLSPEHQDAFEGAVTMLYDVLYKNPQTSKAMLDQIVADEDPQIKTEAIARATTLLIQQIDEKLDLPNEIMPFFVATAVDRMIELATRVKKVKFDETDGMAAMAATAEGVRALAGGGEDPAAQAPPQAPPAPAAAPPQGVV